MLRLVLICTGLLLIAIGPSQSDTVVANGTIRGQALIGPSDIALVEGVTPGAFGDPGQVVGMEARVNLYPGRPIRPGDVRPPAVIDRNEIVTMRFDHANLIITTEGRALDRAATGERLRVLNLSSRTAVTATAIGPGLVRIGPQQ